MYALLLLALAVSAAPIDLAGALARATPRAPNPDQARPRDMTASDGVVRELDPRGDQAKWDADMAALAAWADAAVAQNRAHNKALGLPEDHEPDYGTGPGAMDAHLRKVQADAEWEAWRDRLAASEAELMRQAAAAEAAGILEPAEEKGPGDTSVAGFGHEGTYGDHGKWEVSNFYPGGEEGSNDAEGLDAVVDAEVSESGSSDEYSEDSGEWPEENAEGGHEQPSEESSEGSVEGGEQTEESSGEEGTPEENSEGSEERTEEGQEPSEANDSDEWPEGTAQAEVEGSEETLAAENADTPEVVGGSAEPAEDNQEWTDEGTGDGEPAPPSEPSETQPACDCAPTALVGGGLPVPAHQARALEPALVEEFLAWRRSRDADGH